MPLSMRQIESATAHVTCPICQSCVINWSEEQYIQPCQHTVFIALDLGFEFVADSFEATLAHSVDDIHQHELNVLDEIKKSTQLSELTIYQMPLGALDYSRYIGFRQR